MAIDFKLPDLGEKITSADVVKVLVAEGDVIKAEQGVVEVETDKATVEVPCSQGGKVTKVHVKEGDSIKVGAVLISLEPAAGGAPAKSAPKAEAKAEAKPKAEPKAEARPEPKTEPKPAAKPQPAAAEEEAEPASGAALGGAASPAVRRLARQLGVDLAKVSGSGSGGRITEPDVMAAVRQRSGQAPAASAPARASQPATAAAPAAAKPASVAGEAGEDSHGPVKRDKLTKIRQTIASRMADSHATIPHVTNFDDADVTELEKIRSASKADYESVGIKLTSLPFVIKACAMALKMHPVINASIDLEAGQVIYKQYVSIGIAVDTDRGLVVPVIRNTDKMSIAEIARALAGVADKARGNAFTIEDLRGGTFTISNLGAIGGTYSTPIINKPEVAILLTGRSRKMPVVTAEGTIHARLMMPLSLSYDHRLVDGAAAARFLNDVKAILENPSRMLLAP